MTPGNLVEIQKWRYATKKFDTAQKISEENWNAMEKSLILTPSSFGLQPWKFVIIQDASLRKNLTPLSWNQTQVQECSHYVVFAAKDSLDEKYIDKYLKTVSHTRGAPIDSLKGYRQMMVGALVQSAEKQKVIFEWAARQVYIALGNSMTAAACLGIDSCPMEGIVNDQYDEVLGLKGSGYKTVVACAFGYRSADDKNAGAEKIRFSQQELIVHK